MSPREDTKVPILKRVRDRIGISLSKSKKLATDENGLPLPGPDLRKDVAGTDDLKWFIQGGKLGADTVVSLLEKQGISFGELNSVLDFGCGCGRVLRHLGHYENVQLHGTDISGRGIAWCDAYLNFAEFGTNRLEPPTRYRSGIFDFIYAFSVFTHLTQELQLLWMKEMRRLLKPEGHILITVHGDHYLDRIPESIKPAYQQGKLVISGGDRVGSNSCAAFHPPSYVRNALAPESGFKVIDFVPEGALGNPKQDAYLLSVHA